MASNIEKILDVLDDNETDINKIANISHTIFYWWVQWKMHVKLYKRMNANVIYNIAIHYAREYGLMDCLDDLKELIKNHGNELFYRYMSLVKNFNYFKKYNVYNWSSQSKGIPFFRRLKEKMLYSS